MKPLDGRRDGSQNVVTYVATGGGMKCATVRDLKNRTSELLRRAADGAQILITSHGRPVAMLTGMNEADLEDWVLANDPELRASIEEADRDYQKNGGIRLKDFIRTLQTKSGGGRRNGGGRKRR
jgi:prevent-host-death family protein